MRKRQQGWAYEDMPSEDKGKRWLSAQQRERPEGNQANLQNYKK
jgi:hypothetical protein